MHWVRGGAMFVRSEDGRFHLSKAVTRDGIVYALADGDELICVERGEGAKERCIARAEEIVAGTNGIGS